MASGNIVTAGGFTPDCYADFTRLANTTAYAAGQCVNDAPAAASAQPLRFPAVRAVNGSGIITGGRIIKSSDTTANASFRLWLFANSPFTLPVSGVGGTYFADAGTINFTFASMARFVGFLDFTTFIDAGTMAVGEGVATRSVVPFSKRFVADKADSTADSLSIAGISQSVPAAQLLYGILEARAAYVPTSGEQFRIWLDVQAD